MRRERERGNGKGGDLHSEAASEVFVFLLKNKYLL